MAASSTSTVGTRERTQVCAAGAVTCCPARQSSGACTGTGCPDIARNESSCHLFPSRGYNSPPLWVGSQTGTSPLSTGEAPSSWCSVKG